jgi:hypothetical protein
MSVLARLSSQVGDRTEAANRAVAAECLQQPGLLADIVAELNGPEAALAGDCAEVLTKVAEAAPELVAPYAPALAPLLGHKATPARWEAMHALALVAGHAPRVMARLLPELARLIQHDHSMIMRDYAVEALGNYAGSSRAAAESAYPLLRLALHQWEGKHAARALNGLTQVAGRLPGRAGEIRALAYAQLSAGRGVTRKAARALLKATEASTGKARR